MIKKALKTHFNYDSFRDGQRELIEALVDNRDTLGILPTSGGKSICFQLPAMIKPGVTLVICPLISLMVNQVDALKKLGIAAEYINSTVPLSEQRNILSLALNGKLKLLYIAPERLENAEFIENCKRINLTQIIVDEAHCISMWGHDFRPSYKNIVHFIHQLPFRIPIGAFTATATPKVKQDIIANLELQNPFVYSASFERKNLFFSVKRVEYAEKEKALLQLVAENEGFSGIIYCMSIKDVENLYIRLNVCGYEATKYHAKLDDMEKQRNQYEFMNNKKSIIVATNAFGMGIDKPDIRFVIHYSMPHNLENYYQEAGRAGRDRKQAKCTLIYTSKDAATSHYLIKNTENEDERLTKHKIDQLNAMISYCSNGMCLNKKILEHFGEKSAYKCNHCSVCLKSCERMDALSVARDIRLTVEEVARPIALGDNIIRYATMTIIKLLKGEVLNPKIKHENITCFGKYKNFNDITLKEIIRQMIADDFLNESYDVYRVLSTNNDERFKALTQYVIYVSKVEQIQALEEKSVTLDKHLLERLVNLRQQMALKKGVPPFAVMHDDVLKTLATQKPTTLAELRQIKQLDQTKLLIYGFDILSCVKAYVEKYAK